MINEKGPHYYVAFHSPGPNWVSGKAYNEQPEFQKHVAYISALHDKGMIVLSGPFMTKPGGLSGVLADEGMAILKSTDLAEATRIANDDPTVRSGMLEVAVKTMWIPFQG